MALNPPETPAIFEGIAAVYAEAEAFDLAIQFAERAFELARAADEVKHAMRLMESIKAYRYEVEQSQE